MKRILSPCNIILTDEGGLDGLSLASSLQATAHSTVYTVYTVYTVCTVCTVLYTVPYADEEVNHEEEGKQRLVEVESKAHRVNGDAESASNDNVQHEKSSHPHGTTVYSMYV